MYDQNCGECDKDFKTSEMKVIGDTWVCPHCGTKYVADSDYGDDDEIIWFPVRFLSKDLGLNNGN